MDKENTAVLVGILAVSIAGIAGIWYGRSLERSDFERLIARTESCPQQLEAAARDMNETENERRAVRPDRW